MRIDVNFQYANNVIRDKSVLLSLNWFLVPSAIEALDLSHIFTTMRP